MMIPKQLLVLLIIWIISAEIRYLLSEQKKFQNKSKKLLPGGRRFPAVFRKSDLPHLIFEKPVRSLPQLPYTLRCQRPGSSFRSSWLPTGLTASLPDLKAEGVKIGVAVQFFRHSSLHEASKKDPVIAPGQVF